MTALSAMGNYLVQSLQMWETSIMRDIIQNDKESLHWTLVQE